MEDYRLEQTGQEVQRILNGAAMDANLQAEVERATDAEGTLQENIDAEAQARQDADSLLQQGIDDEAQRAKDAEEANAGEIEGIKDLIPSTASEGNKLADTNYVNSSIQTATAEYRGDYNVVTDLHLAIDATHAQIEKLLPTVIAEADKNDYCYVMIPTSAQTPTEIAKIERYKMTSEGWKFEYDVNNSTFTAEEWAAIKSGITSGLVAKLNALPTNADLLLLLAGKQDVLTFDSVPVPESNNPVKSGGVYSAIDDEKTARLNSETAIHTELDGLQAKVPATASSDNKLVDQNQMNSSISTATATYRGDWNVVSDLHLAVDATRAQIAALLPTVISTADNNDYCYVEIPTNAETPTQIERVERFKFNGTAWAYEYTLNNSGFTADQWAAINSMITSGLVAKLSALPTNADLLAMLAQKQDNLTFDSTPTENSTNPVTSGGVFAADKALSDAIEAILLLIPSAASSLNKLVDTALLNSSISTATATFRGTYNLVSDLGLGIDATEGQIAAALLSAISTADNNDYTFVQIPTSAQTPAQIARTDRYKFNGTAWAFEYTLNTSGFTAAQWAAINSGVTDTLVAELANIANLIPSEASQYNKLADKVYVITQIIAHIADSKGEYGTLLELQSVLNPKPGDLGIVRTKDNDGKDVYTFYQYKDSLWNEYYTLSYHPQIKPATTGTTGDYPYNGMGRAELPMNMVNGVNTLTQDMFYKGTVGFREPNTNTIFVIRYDFTLGEDITVPANCVLEFDGGSISTSGSNDTITGQNTCINAGLVKIFNTDVILGGTWKIGYGHPEWFGAKGDGINDDTEAFYAALSKFRTLYLSRTYSIDFRDVRLESKMILGAGRVKSKIIQRNSNVPFAIVSNSVTFSSFAFDVKNNTQITDILHFGRHDSSFNGFINTTIRDILFLCSASPNKDEKTIPMHFNFRNGGSSGITVEDIIIARCYIGLWFEFPADNTSMGWLTQSIFKDIIIYAPANYGLKWEARSPSLTSGSIPMWCYDNSFENISVQVVLHNTTGMYIGHGMGNVIKPSVYNDVFSQEHGNPDNAVGYSVEFAPTRAPKELKHYTNILYGTFEGQVINRDYAYMNNIVETKLSIRDNRDTGSEQTFELLDSDSIQDSYDLNIFGINLLQNLTITNVKTSYGRDSIGEYVKITKSDLEEQSFEFRYNIDKTTLGLENGLYTLQVVTESNLGGTTSGYEFVSAGWSKSIDGKSHDAIAIKGDGLKTICNNAYIDVTDDIASSFIFRFYPSLATVEWIKIRSIRLIPGIVGLYLPAKAKTPIKQPITYSDYIKWDPNNLNKIFTVRVTYNSVEEALGSTYMPRIVVLGPVPAGTPGTAIALGNMSNKYKALTAITFPVFQNGGTNIGRQVGIIKINIANDKRVDYIPSIDNEEVDVRGSF